MLDKMIWVPASLSCLGVRPFTDACLCLMLLVRASVQPRAHHTHTHAHLCPTEDKGGGHHVPVRRLDLGAARGAAVGVPLSFVWVFM